MPERGVLFRRHPLDAEFGRRDERRVAHVHLAGRQLLAQPLHLGLGLDAQRIVGLHAQHEVHAALQVEPQLQRLVEQPGRLRDAVARRDDRIDAHRGEHDEDDENGDDLPAQIRHGLWLRGLPLIAADRRLRDLDTDLVRDLELHALIGELRDLPVDTAGRDHAVADFQRSEKLLNLLLLSPHRQQDDEVEDAQDEHERHELEPGAPPVKRGAEGQQWTVEHVHPVWLTPHQVDHRRGRSGGTSAGGTLA